MKTDSAQGMFRRKPVRQFNSLVPLPDTSKDILIAFKKAMKELLELKRERETCSKCGEKDCNLFDGWCFECTHKYNTRGMPHHPPTPSDCVEVAEDFCFGCGKKDTLFNRLCPKCDTAADDKGGGGFYDE